MAAQTQQTVLGTLVEAHWQVVAVIFSERDTHSQDKQLQPRVFAPMENSISNHTLRRRQGESVIGEHATGPIRNVGESDLDP